MSGVAWALICATCTAMAVMWTRTPNEARDRLESMREQAPADDAWTPTSTLVVQLVVAALDQGASIPDALRAVGACCGTRCAAALAEVTDALMAGVPWDDAWSVADVLAEDPTARELAGTLRTLADALRSPWQDGSAAVPRLRAAGEQLDSLERMRIERAASALSVRMLLPMGLCFLPAFLCIAVVPTVMSFAQG